MDLRVVHARISEGRDSTFQDSSPLYGFVVIFEDSYISLDCFVAMENVKALCMCIHWNPNVCKILHSICYRYKWESRFFLEIFIGNVQLCLWWNFFFFSSHLTIFYFIYLLIFCFLLTKVHVKFMASLYNNTGKTSKDTNDGKCYCTIWWQFRKKQVTQMHSYFWANWQVILIESYLFEFQPKCCYAQMPTGKAPSVWYSINVLPFSFLDKCVVEQILFHYLP